MGAGLAKGVLVGALAAGLLAPAAAQAGTHHWATALWIDAGQALRNPNWPLITGVYCHELDVTYTRQIQINATYPNGTLYGTWVQFATDGYRSYAGANYLSGACKNPHSVGYSFSAHDNHIDI